MADHRHQKPAALAAQTQTWPVNQEPSDIGPRLISVAEKKKRKGKALARHKQMKVEKLNCICGRLHMKFKLQITSIDGDECS